MQRNHSQAVHIVRTCKIFRSMHGTVHTAQIFCDTWIWCFSFVVVQNTVAPQYGTENGNKIRKKKNNNSIWTIYGKHNACLPVFGRLCAPVLSFECWLQKERRQEMTTPRIFDSKNVWIHLLKRSAHTQTVTTVFFIARLCDGFDK